MMKRGGSKQARTVAACALFVAAGIIAANAQEVTIYETKPDLSVALSRQPAAQFQRGLPSAEDVITVNASQRFQTMDGFGADMTDSSAWLLQKQLNPADRSEVMHRLFGDGSGIAVSFVRVPLGASDLALDHYSYDDMPSGQSDPQLKHFSIAHDRAYIVPALREALQLNPAISIMVVPWSPPGWMKTTGSMVGGRLKPEDAPYFAEYLVKAVTAYEGAGIPVNYLSIQNEPLYNTPDYPGMVIPASQAKVLIARFVGPMLRKASPRTKILAYDHNWDHPEYPEEILSDPEAAQYVAGTAFHCYGGNVSAQTAVHDRFPEKGIWMTECSGGGWQKGNLLAITENTIIQSVRNWAKAVALWALVLDQDGGPHAGGCSNCRGLVTVYRNQKPHTVTFTPDFYAIGQASRFIRPGAVRIGSNNVEQLGLETMAFQNPDHSFALLVLNSAEASRTFTVEWHGRSFRTRLDPGSVSTYLWSAKPSRQQAVQP